MPREVVLVDPPPGEGVDVGEGVAARVEDIDPDVVQIEEDSAVGPLAQGREESRFIEGVPRKVEIGRGVLEEEEPACFPLETGDLVGDPIEHRLVEWDREEIVVLDALERGDAQVVRVPLRFDPIEELGQAEEIVRIRGVGGSQRQADPVGDEGDSTDQDFEDP